MKHEWRFPIVAFDHNYDGDTFTLTVDLGFHTLQVHTVRLDGIDTPELRGGTPETRWLAERAKQVAHDFVRAAVDGGDAFFISTKWAGKYGRPIGRIKWGAVLQHDLGATLVESRLAVRYHGGDRVPLQGRHQSNAEALMPPAAAPPAV